MKKILTLLLITPVALMVSCEKNNPQPDTGTTVQKGIAKGKVTNANGSPIINANVVIENTVFYASYVHAVTNAKGEYSVQVPNGSWKASVQIEKVFEGNTYKFDLHPDNENPFAGTEGAVRNFTWKLSGAKPGGGFYGSTVAVYPDILSGISEQDIELKLVPVGNLADGSTGATITKKLADAGGGEYGVTDVPVGKYIISARNTSTNQPLEIRRRNTGNFASELNAVFAAGYTGSTHYQIVTEVK